jgi:energy-converting hydrogenase Eha subunit H
MNAGKLHLFGTIHIDLKMAPGIVKGLLIIANMLLTASLGATGISQFYIEKINNFSKWYHLRVNVLSIPSL